MGKSGAGSWLSAVKKALSPTKGSQRRVQQQEEDHKIEHCDCDLRVTDSFVGNNHYGNRGMLRTSLDPPRFRNAKRGKKRWMFRKSTPYERTIEHKEAKNVATPCNVRAVTTKSTGQGKLGLRLPVFDDMAVPDQRRAMAVAMATTAAAEAAVATAQAAVEVMRLASPSIIIGENYAAVAIQAAFRGYLARRALKALKGVVRLQAFVRGYNVRKRAEMTLQCMQSLMWVQNQVRYQNKRLSTDSMFSPPKNIYQIADMKSNSKGSTSSFTEDEDHQNKPKEAIFKHKNSLAYAFSRQIWRSEFESRQQEDKLNPRERTPAPKSPISRQNQQPIYSLSSPIHTSAQTLLINSLTSPHRSRIRTLKSQSEKMTYPSGIATPSGDSPVPSYMATTESARLRSKSAPRQRMVLEREREKDRESGLSSAKKRLSFAGKDLYSGV